MNDQLNLSKIHNRTIEVIRKEYLNLFADLNKQYNSLEWWFSQIASKNSERCKVINCADKDILTIHNEIINIYNRVQQTRSVESLCNVIQYRTAL